jgi:hypothetical protein
MSPSVDRQPYPSRPLLALFPVPLDMQSDPSPSLNSLLIAMEPDPLAGSSKADTQASDFPIVEPIVRVANGNGYTSERRGRFPYDAVRSPEQEQKVEAFRQVLERHRGDRQIVIS